MFHCLCNIFLDECGVCEPQKTQKTQKRRKTQEEGIYEEMCFPPGISLLLSSSFFVAQD